MSDARLPGQIETAADAKDPTLRGRTCAIPFEDVWRTSLHLAGSRLRNWSINAADDNEGRIDATARRLTGGSYDVVITITLDTDAQTRVDARAIPHKPGTDFGSAARLLRRFFRALDGELAQLPQRGFVNRT